MTEVNLTEPRAAVLPGFVIHGFCGGAFGRDSYACRRVEAVGPDWVVTRNEMGEVELVSGNRVPTRRAAEDRSFCSPECSGPDRI